MAATVRLIWQFECVIRHWQKPMMGSWVGSNLVPRVLSLGRVRENPGIEVGSAPGSGQAVGWCKCVTVN